METDACGSAPGSSNTLETSVASTSADVKGISNKKQARSTKKSDGKVASGTKKNCPNFRFPYELGADQSPYIATGVYTDCANLLARFSQQPGDSYQDFCKVWKAMHFHKIFTVPGSAAEYKEFVREAFIIAKIFILSEQHRSSHIFGIYLLFAFFHTQNIWTAQKRLLIPITPEELVQLLAKRSELGYGGEVHDALHVMSRLFEDGCFRIMCQNARPYGPERGFRRYFEGGCTTEIEQQEVLAMQKNYTSLDSIVAPARDALREYAASLAKLKASGVIDLNQLGISEKYLPGPGGTDPPALRNLEMRTATQSSSEKRTADTPPPPPPTKALKTEPPENVR